MQVKGSVNRFKTIALRKQASHKLVNDTRAELLEEFNPDISQTQPDPEAPLSEKKFIAALNIALQKISFALPYKRWQALKTKAKGPMSDAITRNATLFDNWLNINLASKKEQVTRTWYKGNLTYLYNRDAQGKLINNKLGYVKDTIGTSAAHSINFSQDIDDQSSGNYQYDSIGNLVKDDAEKFCINKTDAGWEVYYSERGSKSKRQIFTSENEPVIIFIDLLLQMR